MLLRTSCVRVRGPRAIGYRVGENEGQTSSLVSPYLWVLFPAEYMQE